jgi:RND family efflux transporter MFP subunit
MDLEMTMRRVDIRISGGLALLLAAGACNGSVEAGDTAVAGAPAEEFTRVINVVVQELGSSDFTEEIQLTGTVEAARDVTVSAEEGGVVRELLVPKGAAVEEGQPILRIDDAVLRPQVERARAEAALAKEQWDRRKRLFEEDGVGAELTYLEARLTSEQANAQLAVLEERLARTVVRAPFAGMLEERFVEVGTMVSPGTPVVRILQMNPVKVTAGVPERYAPDVRSGASVRVTFDVLPERTFEGRVGFVGAAVNPRNRTFPVEVSIPNPGAVIKPEMVANVALVRRTVVEALVVPQEAVVRVSDGHAVYVVTGQGGAEVAERREVTLGVSQRNMVTITSGLEPGDRVIVIGQQQVANGDRVRIVEAR